MRDLVVNIFQATLQQLHASGQLDVAGPYAFAVAVPKSLDHGDYAVNAAMALSKPAKQKPRDLAEKLVANLVDPDHTIAKAEVAGPGFINVRLADSLWRSVVGQVERAGASFGSAAPGSQGSINIEFVSANPTGPLHVGHGRGAVVGDAIARLLKAAGHTVTREYYVNDFGNQVDILGRSLHLRYQELQGRVVEFPKDAYPAEYVRDIARTLVDEFGAKYLDAPEAEWLPLFRQKGIAANMAAIKADLELASVAFDVWSHESELHASGTVLALVEELRSRGNAYVAEQSQAVTDKVRREDSKAAKHQVAQAGGTFARLAAFGDSDDRIVLRADGRPVYLTSDLAYHVGKLRRGFERCIDVFGADHFAHTHTLHAGLKALGEESARLEFVLTQIVKLLRGGQEVRISKRAGNIELLSDLLAAVGPDALRFFFLLRAPTAQFDFDLDVATSQSLDNPVFYVQYGHARACAIFRKATETGVSYQGCGATTMDALTLPEELGLCRKMAAFPELVHDAAEAREPHRIVYYLQELVRDFHGYYTRYRKDERVLSDDTRKTQARLGLVSAVRQVERNALMLLGVSAPEQMAPLGDDDATEAP